MKPITQTYHYPNASVHGHKTDGLASEWTSAMWNWPKQKEKLVGKNSESDGVGFGLVSGLLTDPHVTINAGETIPANTEIGFMVESGSVLAIELFNNTVLTTYDENDNEVESKKIVSVLVKTSGSTGISLSNIKAYAKDGEAVISASETIKSVQIVTAAGQVLASKQPNSMEVRMPLGQGMNIVKVQTENNVQIIKLINN